MTPETQKATARPWKIIAHCTHPHGFEISNDGRHVIAAVYNHPDGNYAENAKLIVHSVNTLPEVEAELARLRSLNEELVGALKAIRARINGVFDEPALVAFGPLNTDPKADCEAIAAIALARASANDGRGET